MSRALLLAGLALAFALTGITQDYPEADSAPTACETDSDCMLHCPPPADDPDCAAEILDDQRGPARGNHGSQP